MNNSAAVRNGTDEGRWRRLRRDPQAVATVVGALAACALGAIVGATLGKSTRAGIEAPMNPARSRPAASGAQYSPIATPYEAPNRDSIASAFVDGQRLLASQGLSGVARAGIGCFEKLRTAATYRQMDYCLALDVFGARAYSRVSGDDAPLGSYFGQGPVRRLRAVQELTSGQTDPSSRLLDTSQLIERLAPPLEPRSELMALTPAPSAPLAMRVQIVPDGTPKPSATTTIVRSPGARASSAPVATASVALAEPAAPSARPPRAPARPVIAPPQAAPVTPPLVQDVRVAERARAPLAPAPSQPAPGERVGGPFRGPSFNCRYARSPTENMICGEPELAAADRRLARLFDRAMAQSATPRALRREQDRWLADRERQGRDYDAVLDIYYERIRELAGLIE